jgi:hypothetical protein
MSILSKERKKERHKEVDRLSKRKWYKDNKEESKRRVKEWQMRDPKKHNIRQATYRKSHPDKLWIGAVKQRAKARGIEFSITEKDIVIPEFCPILGIRLYRVGGQSSDNSPSIDRIDSTRGYTKDNIQVISTKANKLKNSASLEELVILGEWAKTLILEGAL